MRSTTSQTFSAPDHPNRLRLTPLTPKHARISEYITCESADKRKVLHRCRRSSPRRQLVGYAIQRSGSQFHLQACHSNRGRA